MKAYVLCAVNDLQYKETNYPVCPSGWSIVKVAAAGICSSDIPRIFTKGTYHFPTIPGHEFSGVVVEVADEENRSFLGKRVAVFPLIPCRNCEQCQAGHYELCENYDYIGSRRDGAFAEYVAVPVWNLVPIGEHIDFKNAALMEPLAVALHAVKRSGLKPGDSFAVVGTGTIALAAAQWAVRLGATAVTVLGRSEAKRSFVARFDHVDYQLASDCDDEFNVVLEAVGSSVALEQAITHAKADGMVVLIGNPYGDMTLEQNVYWRILRKQLKLVGTWNSTYEFNEKSDWLDVKEALEKNDIDSAKLITHVFPSNKLQDGLIMMHEHKEPFCKVMIIWKNSNQKEAADE